MYRKSAVGKKQQFEFSGGRAMEGQVWNPSLLEQRNRPGCSHPAPPPLHSPTQTLIFLLPIATSPSDFPS